MAISGSRVRLTRVEQLEKSEIAELAMQEALSAQAAGDFSKAADLLADIVVAQPFNGIARLHLGIIYQDSLDDPFAAIGEFNAYLRLRPDAEKVNLVEERIKLCKETIGKTYASLASDVDYDSIVKDLKKKIAELEKLVSEKTGQIQLIEAECDSLKVEKERLSADLNRKIKLLDNVLAGDEAAKPDPLVLSDYSPPTNTGTSTDKYWEHQVVRGDTLTSLAQKLLGDAARVRELRDINKDKLGPRDTLIEGTVILIPRELPANP